MLKRPLSIAIILSFLSVIVTLIIFPRLTIPVITYFPVDEHAHFIFAETDLIPIDTSNENSNILSWETLSKSNEALYLRQDISLLYENGYFKGLLSKWTQQSDTMEMQKRSNRKDNSFYQAISYHYGEVHHEKDMINSIQHMSSTSFLNSGQPINGSIDNQNQIINKQTNEFWNRIMKEYDIEKSLYLAVPLTDLDYYNSNTLPLLTSEQTNKVIGQLWEGLYKNYVIPITESKSKQARHIVPMVLFHKESAHLIVLFELDGKIQKLFQRYSF